MDKNKCAVTPPMGWNSYDYYDTTVNEEQIKANADFMADKLKNCGWEYIVIDIEWYAYDAGTQRDKYQYIPFWKVEMDEYSRLQPCEQRFPSSVGGKGFKPLADYIHEKGLKFGIHIMRGIPRIAAHNHTRILGSERTANEIADPSSICEWNPDMYGTRPDSEGAQEYYDSIISMYAEWGVDFIKCDDICRMDRPSAKKEIEMIAKAIEKSGRQIVFSLSPGPAILGEAEHYRKYANMWRITDDFWDNWRTLYDMFERCRQWESYVSEGCYPDCDMIPVGKLGKGFGEERDTNFTWEEQKTMITLWSMFGSPLMLGAELTKLDEETLSLLTNKEVLEICQYAKNRRQVNRTENYITWTSNDISGNTYIAIFNLTEDTQTIKINMAEIVTQGIIGGRVSELWTGESFTTEENTIIAIVPPHGVNLYKVY